MTRLIKLIFICVVVFSCSTSYVKINSENFDSRVKYIVIHYTSENFAESLRLLTTKTDRPVSSHYLIPELNDKTYELTTTKPYLLVDEHNRAWHAGISYWSGERGLNDNSIGIEIVNTSGCQKGIEQLIDHEDLNNSCYFLSFPKQQITVLVNLIRDILSRYPEIKPYNIIGHSDIAPNRKIDPGPLFPWKTLYENGFGAWYEMEDYIYFQNLFKTQLPTTLEAQQQLEIYGYEIELNGIEDKQSRDAVRAFQMHFRPSNYSGYFDLETIAILYALNKKYR